MKFYVGIARFALDLSSCSSLKDKRRIMRSIVDRLGNSRVTGVAEVADDHWKSGTIALVSVSASTDVVTGSLDRARKIIEGCGAEVVRSERWVLKPEDLEGTL